MTRCDMIQSLHNHLLMYLFRMNIVKWQIDAYERGTRMIPAMQPFKAEGFLLFDIILDILRLYNQMQPFISPVIEEWPTHLLLLTVTWDILLLKGVLQPMNIHCLVGKAQFYLQIQVFQPLDHRSIELMRYWMDNQR